jgi:glycerol-3-phosphate cytidylyltransferase
VGTTVTMTGQCADGRDRVPVGYVSGVFDMFHIGHLNLILRARDCCEVLVAGVLADEEALATKGRLPVVPQEERLAIVRALGAIDEVILDPSMDKRNAWRLRRFDVLYKGDDWRGTEKARVLEDQLAEVGARVEYFPYTAHTSSTSLRRYLEGA